MFHVCRIYIGVRGVRRAVPAHQARARHARRPEGGGGHCAPPRGGRRETKLHDQAPQQTGLRYRHAFGDEVHQQSQPSHLDGRRQQHSLSYRRRNFQRQHLSPRETIVRYRGNHEESKQTHLHHEHGGRKRRTGRF